MIRNRNFVDDDDDDDDERRLVRRRLLSVVVVWIHYDQCCLVHAEYYSCHRRLPMKKQSMQEDIHVSVRRESESIVPYPTSLRSD